MLSKRYESTEFDRRTWLHVPAGTHWSTSSDTHQVVEIQKETSTKMYTPFLSEWINDMDHMRISGIIIIIYNYYYYINWFKFVYYNTCIDTSLSILNRLKVRDEKIK